jgi:curli biogenesis system outer membrane secretion channel CsgG
MKKQLLAVCLAASVPMLAACATTGAETAAANFGDAAAYQAAQAEVARHSPNKPTKIRC